MSALAGWAVPALAASSLLMLLVLALRGPVRCGIGPRLGYWLWAVPALRMVLPPLPAGLSWSSGAGSAVVLFAGPQGVAGASDAAAWSLGTTIIAIWLGGATALFTFHAARHFAFCRKVLAGGTVVGRAGSIRIVAADVEGPLAFGVVRRFIAVPRAFEADFSPHERDLALAHECAHHARGDLFANWLSLAMLAAHWWNPLAWLAIRAFREDQEFAADAAVLAARGPEAVPHYAGVLARAAGLGALPACNLVSRSNLKGRLMMLTRTPRSTRRHVLGGVALALVGGAALAATAPAAAGGNQAVTIGVKPDGAGHYALVIGGQLVAPGAALPGGMRLPASFTAPAGCDLGADAKPFAMAVKGKGATQTYTVMCASAAPAPLRVTLSEGLASLNTMRASVASQPASAEFPETERAHALGAIDRSIHEVEAALTGAA